MKNHGRLITYVLLIGLGLLVISVARFLFFPATIKSDDRRLASHQQSTARGLRGLTSSAPSSQPAGQVQPFHGTPNHYQMAGADHDAFLKNAMRVAYRDTAPNSSGQFQRVSLYRTNLKYPLVRVVETLQLAANGQQIVVGEDAAAADHVLVRAQPGETAADVARVAALNGDTILGPLHTPGYYLVQLPNATIDSVPVAVQALKQSPTVLRNVEPDPIVQASTVPNDPDFSEEWSMNNTGQTGGTAHADISAPSAWDIINGSPNVVVAVIDSGIDFNHPDLAPNIWTNPHPGTLAGYVNDVHGWNFCANNNTPQDDYYHGTHVSGTIGAVGNNGVGVAGVTWHVQLMPLKFLSSDGSGFTSDAVDAISYATAMGARIISNSWGGDAYSQSLKDAIDAANAAGVLFVVAAGNDGQDTDTYPTYPACFSSANIISVAATDANDQLASFSNYGTATVELAAPGVGIVSTLPTTPTTAMINAGLSANYGQLSGTSMSTPLVSGAAALALAQNPALTVAQLKSQLVQRVDTLTQLAGLVQSGGRLNLFSVVNTSWTYGEAALELSSTTFDDSEGNGDGVANAGEIIHLTPIIYNAGGTTANNVTVQIVSQQATATLLTGSISAGTLLPRQTLTLPSPFRIQLSSSLAVGTTLDFDVVISATGLPDVHGTATVVVQASRGYAETSVNFKVGEILPDPARNLVYVTDTTNSRILAIDTALGQWAAATGLSTTTGSGMMAVSVDGTKLYLALPAAQEIEVFSLPSLAPLTTLPINFTPYSLACGTGGRLFASSGPQWSSLYEVNATNGQTVQTFGTNLSIYNAILHTGYNGSRLFVSESEANGSSLVFLPEFDITGPTVSLCAQLADGGSNSGDFAVDDTNGELYLTGTGIRVLNLATDNYSTVWSSTASNALSYSPGSSVVFGASTQVYGDLIVQFDRASGNPLQTYNFIEDGNPIQARGIAATPNGKALYVRSSIGGGNALIGLVGGVNFNLTNPPTQSQQTDLALSTTAFSDSEGNSDGVPNSGEIVDLTPSIVNLGGQAVSNITVALTGDANSSVLSSASQTVNSLALGASASVANPFRVQLASTLAPGDVVNLTFTITSGSGTPQSYSYQLVVHPTLIKNVTPAGMVVGEIFADQQRNSVYMVDETDMEILNFDTDSGHITATVPISGTQAINWANQDSGMMAESVDGSLLYVALPQTNSIQEIALPAFTTVGTWTYSFQPVSLACDAKGRLYCTTTDSTQALVQIDSTSGQVLTHSGPAFVTSILGGNRAISQLRRNAAGTELFGSLNGSSGLGCTIYTFATTGTGVPMQTGTVATSQNIFDYVVDEVNSRFDVAEFDDNVTLIPFNGSTATEWPAETGTEAAAITLMPGGNVMLGKLSPECLDYFSASSGREVYSYGITGNYLSENLQPRGMATTPNGRTVYVETFEYSDSGQLSSNPAEAYGYEVGMIGGPIDMTLPGPGGITLQSLAVTDPSPGSNDGYVHPGQTVQLAPIFKNFLNVQISGVAVQLSTTSSLATVQSPSTSTIGNVASFATFAPSPNFSVAISPSASDGQAIALDFVVTYDNGAEQVIPYTLYVSAPVQAQASVNFQIGEMLSDPNRDLAYVIDVSANLLLAVNTDTGTVTNTLRLPSAPGLGQLALSADGSHLYIALPSAQQIQVVSLPALQQSDIINVNFQPFSLAAGSDGKLYATGGYVLHQIDPTTGVTLGTFYGNGDIIRASDDHSTLAVGPLGVTGVSTLDIYKVNSTGFPTSLSSSNATWENLGDLALDHTYQRMYSAQGAINGVSVMNLSTGTSTLWPGPGFYGEAVCFTPAGNLFTGARRIPSGVTTAPMAPLWPILPFPPQLLNSSLGAWPLRPTDTFFMERALITATGPTPTRSASSAAIR